jgi:hypothetical protein
MQCDQFREMYPSFFGNGGSLRTRFDDESYSDWVEHLNNCQSCGDWYLTAQLEARAVPLDDVPCVHVAYHSLLNCEVHQNAWECPDVALVRDDGTFGIPVRDGGSSFIEINYCPWCGQSLSK